MGISVQLNFGLLVYKFKKSGHCIVVTTLWGMGSYWYHSLLASNITFSKNIKLAEPKCIDIVLLTCVFGPIALHCLFKTKPNLIIH